MPCKYQAHFSTLIVTQRERRVDYPSLMELSTEQNAIREAVLEDNGKDLLVLAGPGSGKTRTLVASIVAAVQQGVAAEKIAAITFTNNAAAELQVRLVELAKDLAMPQLHRVHVSTFHAWVGVLASQLVQPWSYPPIQLDKAGLAMALWLCRNGSEESFKQPEVAAADRHLEGCESFEEMEQRHFNRIGGKGMVEENRIAFEALQEAVATFSRQLEPSQLRTYGTLMRSGARLAEQLPRDSLSWLMIDEAQDLNRPQAEFVEAMQKRTQCRVFAIADDDQGIYKFRGASSRFLLEFGKRPSTRQFVLQENYRSTKYIVQLCRNWIRPNWERLGLPEKKLHSSRTGSSIFVLTAHKPSKRGAHARKLIEALRTAGLIDHLGEVAVLGFSPATIPYDLEHSGLPYRQLADVPIAPEIFQRWLGLCREAANQTQNWHHSLWQRFLDEITADQRAAKEPLLGHPGLGALYGALEAIRRIDPAISPAQAADRFEKIQQNFGFPGSRPEPDYLGDQVNYLSLHSSKGMEFRVVWVTGAGYAFGMRESDEVQGQPNLLGELGAWANSMGGAALNQELQGSDGHLDPVACNRVACELENRRLLYVGMSRATDLLIISAPEGSKNDNALQSALRKAARDTPVRWIESEADLQVLDYTFQNLQRHPTWSPPIRYRVESYTSQTQQPLPSDAVEAEIPRDREYPRVQSIHAQIGDQFHRIMHLLCLDPTLLQKRLRGEVSNDDLIARVTTIGAAIRSPLETLLDAYFADITNQPWTWMQGGRSEVPFAHVPPDRHKKILLKGYIDLVQFNENQQPIRVVDYKVSECPPATSAMAKDHQHQLQLYRQATSTMFAVEPASIECFNYYLPQCIVRPLI